MTRMHRCGICGLLAVAILAGLFAGRSRVLPLLYRWLDVGETPPPADCVLVLGGDENVRPFVAAALVKVGLARRVLVTHVEDSADAGAKIIPSTHEISRRVLIRRGVAEKDIVLIGHDLTTTFDEAQALRDYLRTAPASRVLVVTNDCHTRRARWVFRRVLGGAENSVTFVSAPTDGFDAKNWWQTSPGFKFVVGEYCKLAFYGAWYGWWGYMGLAATLGAGAAWIWRRWRRHGPARRNAQRADATLPSADATPP